MNKVSTYCLSAWIGVSSGTLFPLYGQENIKTTLSPVHTAVPSLTITPDARGNGIGDAGVASLPDVWSQYWNPAKYSFTGLPGEVGISYTPWLQKWVNDMALLSMAGYWRLKNRQEQALAFSVRYFTLGEITGGTDGAGGQLSSVHPYEMAIDLSYSRRFSRSFGMAATLRYIRSDMGISGWQEMQPANAFSVDLSGYGETYFMWGGAEALWSYGFHISNIGTRLSYDGGATNYFLPALLKIGNGILYPLNPDNHIGFYFDIHKYLVPSLPIYTGTNPEDEEDYVRKMEKYNNYSSLQGVFRSFSDAPGGFREELKEILFSIGVEYRLRESFFIRSGYYYENKYKGNRQYATVGTGIRYKAFQLDLSWLISTIRDNPLDQTLRISLSMDIQGIKRMLD